MTGTTPPAMRARSRRALLTSAAASLAAAALAACGGSPSPTVPTAPMPPAAPTDTPAITAAPSPPPATSLAVPTPPAAPTPTRIARPVPTAVSVPAPLGPGTVLNVKQFGATGDGTTDDTAAIQAAINAVPPSGGTVQFPPGTYIVAPQQTVGIAIKSNLNLVGAGAASVLKIKDHLGDWQRLLSPKSLGDAVENVAVSDLAFDANILNNPESQINEKQDATYQTFIHVTAGRNLHVTRCRFAPYAGVWAVSFNGETIRDCSVTDCYFAFVMREGNPDYDNSAIYVEGSNYILSGNRFETVPTPYHEGRACMEAHGGPAEVFNNTARGFQTILNIVGAYFPGGTSRDFICRDNLITDALIGIMLWPTLPNHLRNVTVTNNTVQISQLKHGTADTAGVSVVFSPEAQGRATNITITDNTVTFQDEGKGRPGDFYYNSAGIALHNLAGLTGGVIERNTIEYAPSSGILVGNDEPGQRLFSDVRIVNNRIVNAGQNLGFPTQFRAGVLVNSSASNVSIIANTITDTYPTPRCPAAIAVDATGGGVYSGIVVADNVIQARGGTLPIRMPDSLGR